jgi:SAM-dependent methyltransferase
MSNKTDENLVKTLWKIYHRLERPVPWAEGRDFHWNDPEFSQRILREHLDDSHGVASRVTTERNLQITWLWQKLNLRPDVQILDVTCGPGLYAVELARRGCQVTGIDFSSTSITYANKLAFDQGVATKCTFIEQDVRQMNCHESSFDIALFLYGELATFSKDEAQSLLAQIARALKPRGKLCLELLNQDWVDKSDSTWWFTDDTGLWGDTPFLHLGERFWNETEELSIERYNIVHLETGELGQIYLHDQTYAIETMTDMLKQAGFDAIDTYPSWDELPLYDAEEWVVYVASKLSLSPFRGARFTW